MKKSMIALVVFLFSLSCMNQAKIIISQNKKWEIFYPEKKQWFYYRKNIVSVNKPAFTSIVAVGDIMIGEHVVYYLDKYGAQYPFDSTKTLLTNAHFTIGNLEAPFSISGKKFEKKFNFKVHPRYATGLVQAGFDVVNLANNHIMDYGKTALASTLNTLDSIGVKYCGAGLNYEQAKQPAVIEFNEKKVAFIGCSMTFPSEFWATKDSAGTYYPREHDLIQTIELSKKNANFTVVSFHWGQELRTSPKDYQIYFAHVAIDAGADLILGHHPHVLQGLEIYKNRLIVYSLGNFAFGSYSDKSNESIILKTYLTFNGLLYARIVPISVVNSEVAFQPRVLNGSAAKSVINHLNRISIDLNMGREIMNEQGIILGDWVLQTDTLALNTF